MAPDTQPTTAFDVIKTIGTIWAVILSIATTVYGLVKFSRNRLVLNIEGVAVKPRLLPLLFKRFTGTDPQDNPALPIPQLIQIEMKIKNVGRQEVKDIMLHLPDGGFYAEGEGSTTLTDFRKDIKVGSLRPRASIDLIIWVSALITLRQGDIYATHAHGEAKVNMGVIKYHDPENKALGFITVFVLLVFVVILGGMVANAYLPKPSWAQ